ncbi:MULTISPECIES: hypothetical protein [unclassified Streptomyces]|uniref:hypothetical protein n=1 Tax=unclassified Streptomyces TaxID=2593676 RepID=UPI0036EED6CB
MALYLVSRTDDAWWDEYRSILVRAANETGALAIVTDPTADNGAGPWGFEGFNPDGSNLVVERIDGRGPAAVILSDFKAG